MKMIFRKFHPQYTLISIENIDIKKLLSPNYVKQKNNN